MGLLDLHAAYRMLAVSGHGEYDSFMDFPKRGERSGAWDPDPPAVLRVLRVGAVRLEPGPTPLLTAPFFRAHLYDQPVIMTAPDSTRYALEAGRLHCIPLWFDHYRHVEAPLRHVYIHFKMASLDRDAVAEAMPGPLTPPLPPDVVERAWALGGRVASLSTPPGPSMAEPQDPQMLPPTSPTPLTPPTPPPCPEHWVARAEARATATALAARLMEATLAMLEAPRRRLLGEAARLPPRLELVCAHVRAHLAEPLRLPDLAALADCSEVYLRRLFADHLSASPAKWIQRQRVERAAGMLASGEATLERIAARCGFADRYYMSRVFAKTMGIPPATYRHRHRLHG